MRAPYLLCVGSAETGCGCQSDVLHCLPLPSHHVICCPLASRLVVPPLTCLIFDCYVLVDESPL